MRTKNSELTRSLALAEGQERALKSNVSSAESTTRGLKEQAQRMKTTVQQVRAQCANDIRKRDLELQKLKSHLAERQRGKREGLGVTTINVNPAVDRGSRSKPLGGDGIHDPGYSLKQETNDFLTELCQNLSDENDTLISLARNTIQTLNDLQGLSHDGEEEPTNGTASISTHKSSVGPVTTLPASCEELSSQMEKVLDHLKTLLTNPSFVPLEEVEVRDEEIKRLQEGWEKMESRWKQTVSMMDGWHKRISDGGDSVQIEELKMGMELDSFNAHSTDADPTTEPIFEDVQAEEAEEGEARDKADSAEPSRPRTRRQTANRALKERSDNIRTGRSPRKVSFTPGLQDSPCDPDGEDDETVPVKAHKSDAVTRRPRRKLERPSRPVGRRTESSNQPIDTAPDTKNTRMTVGQKLAAAETEARAAEQTRKESESRKRSRAGRNMDRGSKDRRRSTLTNDELEELMGMSSR